MGQQIGPHRTSPKLLQAQTINNTKSWNILFEGLSSGYFSTFQFRELLKELDIHTQVLAQELLQTRQFGCVAEQKYRFEFPFFVNRFVEIQRSLNFGYHIVEDGSHRLKNKLGVIRLHRIAFEMLRFRKR